MSDRRPEPNERRQAGPAPESGWQIRLPDRVASKLRDRLEDTEFDSIDAYVAFAMASLLRELEDLDDEAAVPGDHDDPANADDLEDRLESLGYL